MLEKSIEKRFSASVKARGGLAIKLVSPGFAGLPDRLVLLDGKAAFVEVKRKGGKPRPLQKARHELLTRLGFKVFVLDDIADIPKILDEITAAPKGSENP